MTIQTWTPAAGDGNAELLTIDQAELIDLNSFSEFWMNRPPLYCWQQMAYLPIVCEEVIMSIGCDVCGAHDKCGHVHRHNSHSQQEVTQMDTS